MRLGKGHPWYSPEGINHSSSVREIKQVACNTGTSTSKKRENFAIAGVTSKWSEKHDFTIRWLARQLCMTINFSIVLVLGALNREKKDII